MASFIDNFTNFSGWSGTGLTTTGGLVTATAGGSIGTLVRPLTDSLTPVRLAFDIKINKADTVGRYAYAGAYGATQEGTIIGYTAGTGITQSTAFSFIPGPFGPFTSTLIADSALVDGETYHFECIFTRFSDRYSVVIYAKSTWTRVGSFALIAFNGRADPANITIISNSTLTQLSHMAADTALFGSAGSQDNFQAPAYTEWYSGTIRTASIWLPGRPQSTPAAVIICPPKGAPAFTDPIMPLLAEYRNAALSSGYPVVMLSGYGDATTDTDSWGCPAAVAVAETFLAQLGAQLGFAGYAKHIVAASMGGTLAAHLIGDGRVANVRSVMWLRAVSDIATIWTLIGGFRASIQTALGYTPTDASDAHARWDAVSPLGLIAATPERFRGIKTLLSYSTQDGLVGAATYGDPLDAVMTANGIPHTYIRRTYPDHPDPQVQSEAQAWVGTIVATDGLLSHQSDNIAAIVTALRASFSETPVEANVVHVQGDSFNGAYLPANVLQISGDQDAAGGAGDFFNRYANNNLDPLPADVKQFNGNFETVNYLGNALFTMNGISDSNEVGAGIANSMSYYFANECFMSNVILWKGEVPRDLSGSGQITVDIRSINGDESSQALDGMITFFSFDPTANERPAVNVTQINGSGSNADYLGFIISGMSALVDGDTIGNGAAKLFDQYNAYNIVPANLMSVGGNPDASIYLKDILVATDSTGGKFAVVLDAADVKGNVPAKVVDIAENAEDYGGTMFSAIDALRNLANNSITGSGRLTLNADDVTGNLPANVTQINGNIPAVDGIGQMALDYGSNGGILAASLDSSNVTGNIPSRVMQIELNGELLNPNEFFDGAKIRVKLDAADVTGLQLANTNAGADTLTWLIKINTNGTVGPLADADAWISLTNDPKAAVVDRGRTGSDGTVRLLATKFAGDGVTTITYYGFAQKDGVTSIQGATLTCD